jgi:hypothetical protein
MSLSRLWPLLEEQGVDVGRVWQDLCTVVVTTLFSAQDAIPGQVRASNRTYPGLLPLGCEIQRALAVACAGKRFRAVWGRFDARSLPESLAAGSQREPFTGNCHTIGRRH